MTARALEAFNRSKARRSAYVERNGIALLSVDKLASLIRAEWQGFEPMPQTDQEWHALAQDAADYLLPRQHQVTASSMKDTNQ
jgi:hypothetical protein